MASVTPATWWSGRAESFTSTPGRGDYGSDKPHDGGFLLALQDKAGTGKADVIERFGETVQSGGAGGTGIGIYKGIDLRGDQRSHRAISLPSVQLWFRKIPRKPSSPGCLWVATIRCIHSSSARKDRCMSTWLRRLTPASRKTGNPTSPARTRVPNSRRAAASALRCQQNESDILAGGPLRHGDTQWRRLCHRFRGAHFVTQHGRDQLHANWPALYKPSEEATLPAEELLLLKSGGDYGWPECYYDAMQKKLVLAPEYGGDGGRKVGVCATKTGPVAAFPAHWGPNGMVRYDKKQFPARYREGVFIAFHGSWDRAPYPQGGYNVVFQPLAGTRASEVAKSSRTVSPAP